MTTTAAARTGRPHARSAPTGGNLLAGVAVHAVLGACAFWPLAVIWLSLNVLLTDLPGFEAPSGSDEGTDFYASLAGGSAVVVVLVVALANLRLLQGLRRRATPAWWLACGLAFIAGPVLAGLVAGLVAA